MILCKSIILKWPLKSPLAALHVSLVNAAYDRPDSHPLGGGASLMPLALTGGSDIPPYISDMPSCRLMATLQGDERRPAAFEKIPAEWH